MVVNNVQKLHGTHIFKSGKKLLNYIKYVNIFLGRVYCKNFPSFFIKIFF